MSASSLRSVFASQKSPPIPSASIALFNQGIASSTLPPRIRANISKTIKHKRLEKSWKYKARFRFYTEDSTSAFKTSSKDDTIATLASNLQTSDASLSQPSSRFKQGQGVPKGKPSPEETNFIELSQARDACQVEAFDTNTAKMAEVNKLESNLGGYLFKGLDTSGMRRREKERRCMRFTDTVHLQIACEGEDFMLEIWLNCLIGKTILQATTTSIDDLRNMLGDYVFEPIVSLFGLLFLN